MASRRLIAPLLAAVLLTSAATNQPAQAKVPPVKKCKGFSSAAPVGKIRTRAVSCASARFLIDEWFNEFQERAGRSTRVIRIGSELEFRCVFRQHQPRNPNYNPYAVVKCKAPRGRRLSFEGYA